MSDASASIPGVTGATEIGRGGFGVVYRAAESDLGRDVAIKILSGQMDERSEIRFERERKAMGALSGHPNIVTIFRSGTTEQGALYLLMEYLPGGSLAERLSADGALSVEETLRIGVELSGALETAHRAGVLHRDVKPENVMVDSLGRAKLGDFGIARLDGSPETKSAIVTASVAHAPPEIIDGKKPDERSDVYSLGSTLYELVSGTPAFSRPTDESMIPILARIVNEPTPDIRGRGIPDALAAILERAMAKQPGERFESAAELGRALADAQRALGYAETSLWFEGESLPVRPAASTTHIVSNNSRVAPSPTPEQQPPAEKKSNSRLIVASVIGILLLVIGIASITRLSGNEDVPQPEGLTGAGPIDGEVTGSDTSVVLDTATTTTDPQTTTRAPETTTTEPATTTSSTTSTTVAPRLPERPVYLADLPPLPSNEPPFTAYRTIGDAEGAFTLRAPVEWQELLAIEGQVIASPDNNAALANEAISGVFVSGSNGIAFWDPDLYLDEFLLTTEDPSDPCTQVKRAPFVDGPFDGLIYAELCKGGDLLVVGVLVSTIDRQSVILVLVQMTDERDMAAFQEALASFILFNPLALPFPVL